MLLWSLWSPKFELGLNIFVENIIVWYRSQLKKKIHIYLVYYSRYNVSNRNSIVVTELFCVILKIQYNYTLIKKNTVFSFLWESVLWLVEQRSS